MRFAPHNAFVSVAFENSFTPKAIFEARPDFVIEFCNPALPAIRLFATQSGRYFLPCRLGKLLSLCTFTHALTYNFAVAAGFSLIPRGEIAGDA
jgi:hypothetical protein